MSRVEILLLAISLTSLPAGACFAGDFNGKFEAKYLSRMPIADEQGSDHLDRIFVDDLKGTKENLGFNGFNQEDEFQGDNTIHKFNYITNNENQLQSIFVPGWYKKLECLNPDLWILNLVFHRNCDIIDGLTPEKKEEEKKRHEDEDRRHQEEKQRRADEKRRQLVEKYTLSFTRVTVNLPKVNPYAYYAYNKTCYLNNAQHSSYDEVGTPPGDKCIYESIEIITPYLFLTNFNFDVRTFHNVIDNVIQRDTTGIVGADPELERSLISAIREAREHADERWTEVMDNVFRSASYLNATTHFLNETLEPEYIHPPTPAPTPALGDYATGRYEMDISQFSVDEFVQQHPPVTPRVWNGNEYVSSNADFETEIIYNISYEQTERIMSLLERWYPETSDSDSDSIMSPNSPEIMGAERLLGTGGYLAGLMRATLRQDPTPNVYIIVSFNNRPMAILQGKIKESSGQAEVDFVLGNPQNITDHPHDQTIRGSAQAALRAFILQCISDDISVIGADAVTHPSARIKVKFGFSLSD